MPKDHSTAKGRKGSTSKRAPRTPAVRTRSPEPDSAEGDHVETLDLIAIGKKWERSARLVKSLFEPGVLPDWLTNLIMLGLDHATEKTGIQHSGENDFDLRGLADLLAVTSTVQHEFALTFVPEMSLPETISAVLKHPELPLSVYEAFSGAIADLGVDDDDPAYIRLALRHAGRTDATAAAEAAGRLRRRK